ncbi:MAG TPA: sodium-dependent transporter [Xanthomonadales bacterium]|nr:sodium-dependent transporter [Xanthomonadales bacterium]
MNLSNPENQTNWSSGWTFVLAAIGAAVGLGNIWKFPYIAGVSGGGAFVLVYVLCAALIAVPILLGELLLGRLGHKSPPVAMRKVAELAGRSPLWSLLGWMGLGVGYLIATYYSVIAGWTLAYIVKAANGFGAAESFDSAAVFAAFLASPATMIAWHTVFISAACIIVARGLHAGIEGAVKVLMPALFIMLLAMIGYAAVEGDFRAGFEFLFHVDFSMINAQVILTAIGQAFFSIGVAMGLMMAYGAYVPSDVSLTRSAFIIAGADTVVALLAGLMIFPLVFAKGLDPAQGPGLIFVTLPAAFAGMPGGQLFGALFFLLLAFAAITSIIAIIEPVVAYAQDRWHMKRVSACLLFGLIAWLLGLLSVFSFNIWAGVHPLGMFETFASKTLFDLIDYFTSNVMMPLGGILIALFVGWRMKAALLASELRTRTGSPYFRIWLFLLRYIAPLAILGVLIQGLR